MFELMDFLKDSSNVLTITFALSVAAFAVLWLINLKTKDAGVVDFYWGPGFSVIAWISLLSMETVQWPHIIFTIAVTIWSFKLAGQLVVRNLGDEHEDARYAKMRAAGGQSFWWKSLLTIYVLQATIMWIVATPIHMGLVFAQPEVIRTGLFGLGLLIAIIGFSLETVADHQLLVGRKKTPANKTFFDGLWGLSRHPNYLGEMIGWVGFGMIGFALSGSFIALIGPVFLIIVIMAVSLPLTEQHMAESRTDWNQYVERVPKLLPNFGIGDRGRNPDPAE